MTWRVLALFAVMMGVANLYSSFTNPDPVDRMADSTGTLLLVLLLCTASIVRAITESKAPK